MAFGVGTTTFADTRRPVKVVKELERWTKAQGAKSVADLTGCVETM